MHSSSAEGSNSPRRGTSSDGEDLPPSPGLLLDKLSMQNQTYYCHPEPKRVTNAIVGTVPEDPSMGPLQAKTHSSLGDKELKEVNSCITDNIVKRRDQLNFLNEPNCKLNGYHRPISLRKRSQTELPASFSNKQVRIRNDSPKVECCSNNIPKSSEMISRERDILISGNCPKYIPKQSRYMLGSGRDECLLKHPCRTIRAGVENWDYAKMTGRCSEMMPDVSVKAVAKMFDGDRDYKPGIQQRPSTESYLRPSESHGFRSKMEKNSSLAASSESPDSDAGDKCKNLIKKQGDTDVKVAPVSQGFGSLGFRLPLKAKTLIKEESGDNLQEPGISGRSNSGLSDFTGDLDDSEQKAPANASNNASDNACSGPLWKIVEPFFASLTQEDPDFFEHLAREVEEEYGTMINPLGSARTGEAHIICGMPPANRKLCDRPQDDYLDCTSEDSLHGNCIQIENNTENSGKRE